MGHEQSLFLTVIDIKKPDIIPVRRLLPEERERALPAAMEVRSEAERLLGEDDTTIFKDSEHNTTHIKSGPALDHQATSHALLQIDRWINRRNTIGRVVGRSLQEYSFQPDGTVIKTSNNRSLIHDVLTNPTWRHFTERHEADFTELTHLHTLLLSNNGVQEDY